MSASVIRTARKAFVCSYCRDEIAKGAQYEHRTGLLRNHVCCTKPERKHLPFYRVAEAADGSGRVSALLYGVWAGMRKRCYSPSNNGYYAYGARGISVCAEWDDYAVFRAWAVANGYRKGLTLDRIDSKGNYGPHNCRWATREEQTYNTKSVHRLTLNGVTKLLPIWAKELGVAPTFLRSRRSRGWTDEQILTSPWGEHRAGVEHQKRGRKSANASTKETNP